MSFVAFATTVGGGSALLGGAMIGAGIGGAYSAITGDGNVLNSMLTGGLIGGAGAGGLSAMGVGSATTAGGATASGISGAGAAKGIGLTAASVPSVAGSAALGGTAAAAPVATGVGGLTAASIPSLAGTLGSTAAGGAGLTGAQMLGYGLAGSSALSLLGNQKRTSAGGGYKEDEYDKRLKGYKISPDYQAYRAPQPSTYYTPTYAAEGGVMDSFDDEAGMDMAGGGMTSLGGYSDGGRMLKGPGDGMSDSIPGVIANKQPARLADGEFVVPADVVSHLGNGSTDAGAKRLYSMMDNIRKARTGKKKQAPEINADKYLPTGKSSGGIAGYASGGVIGYADGGNTNEAAIAQIYQDQFGRTPDAGGLKFYSDALANGMSVADVSKSIAQSLEGQQMDVQAATSAYRQALGRNPEPAGLQYWMSVAQDQGLTAQQLKDSIKAAAVKEQTTRNITEPFTNMQLNSLESDPYAGYYSNQSIYDIAPDAQNVSMIGGRKAQFTTPVTQQAVVSNFINGVYTANSGKDAYTATPGKDILNMPHIQAAINTARDNGTLSASDFSNLTSSLNAAKTPEQIRTALANPKGQVVIDAIYGQQIGEAKTMEAAKAEAAGRQAVLSKQDPGYYQSNRVLTDAYQKAGLTVPFNYANYNGVDTRDRTSNLLTPENLIQKRTDLVNTLNRDNPYRVAYTPTTRGIANMPPSVQDPYSDEGLQFLYGQMMNQYAPPPANFVNPATFTSEPYRYIPPPQNNLTLKSPVADASKPATPVVEAAPVAPVSYSPSGDRAGGLMSINRKKHKRGK